MTVSDERRSMGQNALGRRDLLTGVAGFGAVMALAAKAPSFMGAALAEGESAETWLPFTPETVPNMARDLAAQAFSKPRIDVPEPFNKLTYDQYRDIRFRPEQSVWRGQGSDFELQLFALGYLYDVPVDLSLVENGKSRQLKADGKLFSIGPLIGKGAEQAPYGFSGFRVHGPLNRADVFDEYVVFQGASYFRAVGRDQRYGLSARGLAIDTARPNGEEFPFFRGFWIEKPAQGARTIVIHALLDSASTTGAYKFAVTPGDTTTVDVDFTLYPRKAMAHVGLAPLTSMFRHGAAQNRLPLDYRPAVHDSEGLAILNGREERLWRPLTNPRMLQTSAFIDKDVKGFGLMQRDRDFNDYQDLEAHYERRPSLWIEPKGPWGEGYVELIEIPTDTEVHDNVVAYWKPAKPLEPGKTYTYGYRMHWGPSVPVAWAGIKVVKTRLGNGTNPEQRLFVIDFKGPALPELGGLPRAEVAASAGSIANVVVQENPEIRGLRVSFELNSSGTDVVELRLGLKANDRQISESWLYRWTRS